MMSIRIRNHWLNYYRAASLRRVLVRSRNGKPPSPFDLTDCPVNIMGVIARCSTFLDMERVASYDPFPMRDEGGQG